MRRFLALLGLDFGPVRAIIGMIPALLGVGIVLLFGVRLPQVGVVTGGPSDQGAAPGAGAAGVIVIPAGMYTDPLTGVQLFIGITPTPTLPPTVAPTETPTAVPTATPTVTPQAGQPTPTPEVNPVTPGPTSIPPFEGCMGRVYNPPGLSLRTGPATTYDRIVVLLDGTELEISEFVVYSDAKDEWAKVRTRDGRAGYVAAYFYDRRLLLWDEDDPECYPPGVVITRPGPPTPTPTATAEPEPVGSLIAGIHTLFDTQSPNVTRLHGVIGTLKTTTNAQALGRAYKSAVPWGTWVHRELSHDCPAIYEWLDPALFIRRLEPEWGNGADFYEFINECGAPDWRIFADFTIQVLAAASDRGVCLLWGSFPAGNPDYPAWGELARVIEWADVNPCGVDQYGRPRYHGIALHGPLYMPPDIARGAWVLEPHIVDRLRYVDQAVKAATGAGLADHRSGRVYITEIGLDDGYSGSWSDQFTCDEIARSFWYSVAVYNARYPFVRGLHFWTFGNGRSIWTDRQNCSEAILARAP